VVPVINQVELHPYLQQNEARKAHEELGVLTEAWAPMTAGSTPPSTGSTRSPRTTGWATPAASTARGRST
jgi:diketogulonate reductase-like aldo/keto reductase